MATTHTHRRRSTGADPALAVRLRTGDPAAFDELFRRQQHRVARFVAGRLAGRDRDAIDDLVQDTFCDAIADPAQFGDDPLGTLLRLAARACTRHTRSSQAERRHTRAAYTIYEDRTSPDGGDPASIRPVVGRLEFTHALAQLAPDQRRAIELFYLDGQPHPMVAALMGRSVTAVKSLQRRALHHLKQQLATDGPADLADPVPGSLAPDQATPPPQATATVAGTVAGGGWL